MMIPFLSRIQCCTINLRAWILLWSLLSLCSLSAQTPAPLEVVRFRTEGLGPSRMDDFQTNLRFFELTLRNITASPVQFRLAVEFTVGANVVLQTLNDKTPVYTIQPGEVMTLLTPDAFHRGAVGGETPDQLPILPIEGAYNVCVRVVDPTNIARILISRGCLSSPGSGNVTADNIRQNVKKIMGVDAVIEGVEKVDGGYILSGRMNVPSNTTFTVAQGRQVNFLDTFFPVTAFANNATDITPPSNEMELVDTDIQVLYRNWLPMVIRNTNGLRIRRDPNFNNLPVIRDRMFIDMNRFFSNIPLTAVSDEIRVALPNGSPGTLANNDNTIPAIMFAANAPAPAIAGLRVLNVNDLSWTFNGFNAGKLANIQFDITDSTIVLNGDVPVAIDSATLNAVRLNMIFRGSGNNRVTTRLSVPEFRLGGQQGNIRVQFSQGFFIATGVRFKGQIIAEQASIDPLTFDVGYADLQRQGAKFRFGGSQMQMLTRLDKKIRFEGADTVVYTIEDRPGGQYSVLGVSRTTVAATDGRDYTAPMVIRFYPAGNTQVKALDPIATTYEMPINEGGQKTSLRTKPLDQTSYMVVDSMVVNPVDSVAGTQESDDIIYLRGSIAFNLPKGISVEAGNFKISRSRGLLAGEALLRIRLKNVIGSAGIRFDIDSSMWTGVGGLFFSKGGGESDTRDGEKGLGFDVAVTYKNAKEFAVEFVAVAQPGKLLFLSAPVWINGIGGGLARSGDEWAISLIGRFAILTNEAITPKVPGLDAEVVGTIKFGGDDGVVFMLEASVEARLAGGILKLPIGEGSLAVYITNFRMTASLRVGFDIAGLVKIGGEANLEIHPAANKYYLDAETDLNFFNVIRQSGRFILAVNYSTVVTNRVLPPITLNGFSGIYFGVDMPLLKFSTGFDVAVVSFRVSAYANFGVGLLLGMNEGTFVVDGRAMMNAGASASGSVLGLSIGGSGAIFLYGGINFSNKILDITGRGGFTLGMRVKVGFGGCSPGCNDFDGGFICIAYQACIGVSAGFNLNTANGLSFNVGF